MKHGYPKNLRAHLILQQNENKEAEKQLLGKENKTVGFHQLSQKTRLIPVKTDTTEFLSNQNPFFLQKALSDAKNQIEKLDFEIQILMKI